jgi:hypothetical protein
MKFFLVCARCPIFFCLGCLLVVAVIAVSYTQLLQKEHRTHDSSLAIELETYALLPFEDGELSPPSSATVFVEQDGALLAFEADFGPPENFRIMFLQYSFGPSDIGAIELRENELLFACRGGAKCIKAERHTELLMPIVRTFVDAPRQEEKLVISLASASLAAQQRIRDAFVQGFESIGIQLTR